MDSLGKIRKLKVFPQETLAKWLEEDTPGTPPAPAKLKRRAARGPRRVEVADGRPAALPRRSVQGKSCILQTHLQAAVLPHLL